MIPLSSVDGHMQSPFISSVIPTHGPVAGHTRINLTTGYLGNLDGLSVVLGEQDIPCVLQLNNR